MFLGEKGSFAKHFLAKHTASFNHSTSTTFGYISAGMGIYNVTGADIDGSMTAGGVITHISARRDLRSAMAADFIEQVAVSRDIQASFAAQRMERIFAGRDIQPGSQFEAGFEGIELLSAGRDFHGSIESEGTINYVKAGQDASVSIEANGDLRHFHAGREISGDVLVYGDIDEIAGGIGIYFALLFGGWGLIAAHRNGSITSGSIYAGGNIGRVQAFADPGKVNGSIGGDQPISITALGSIGNVHAAGSLKASIRAYQDIGGVVAGAYLPGDLEGSIVTLHGTIGTVAVYDGNLSASITAGKDIGHVVSAGDINIAVGIKAKRHIGSIYARGDIQGDEGTKIEAEMGSIGVIDWLPGIRNSPWSHDYFQSANYPTSGYPVYGGGTSTLGKVWAPTRNDWESNRTAGGVTADGNIDATITAEDNIGDIGAGRDLQVKVESGKDATEAEVAAGTRGKIGRIRAGFMGGGNILEETEVAAGGAITEVIAYSTWQPSRAHSVIGTQPIHVPLAGPNLDTMGDPQGATWATSAGNEPIPLRKLDPLLEAGVTSAQGDIKGDFFGAAILKLDAYGSVEANVRTRDTLPEVWALKNINTSGDKTIAALDGSVVVNAWGNIGGRIESSLHGGVTARAHGDIQASSGDGSNFSANGAINVSAWGQLSASAAAGMGGALWSFGDSNVDLSAAVGQVVLNSYATVQAIVSSATEVIVRAMSIAGGEYHSGVAPLVLVAINDVAGVKASGVYGIVGAGGNVASLDLKAFSADIVAGRDVIGGEIKTFGLSSFERVIDSQGKIDLTELAAVISLLSADLSGTGAAAAYTASAPAILAYTATQAAEYYYPTEVLRRAVETTYNTITSAYEAYQSIQQGASAIMTELIEFAANPSQTAAEVEQFINQKLEALKAQIDAGVKTIEGYISEPEKVYNALLNIKNAMFQKAVDGVNSAVGFASIIALNNVDYLTTDVASTLSIAAKEVNGGSLNAFDVSISTVGPIATNVEAKNDVSIESTGEVSGFITADRAVRVQSRGNVAAEITGLAGVGIETWGSISEAVSSNGVIRVEAYQDITAKIDSGLTSSISTWGSVLGDVSSKNGAVDIFAAKDVTKNVIAGTDVSIDAWGNVSSDMIIAGANRSGSPDHEFGIDITALGDISAETITAANGINIVTQKSLTLGMITAGSSPYGYGGVSIEVLDSVSGVTVTARDGISVIALKNIAGSFTGQDSKSAVSLAAHGEIDDAKVKAGMVADLSADKKIKANVELTETDGSVSLEALGIGNENGSQTVIRGEVTAPGSSVAFFGNGNVDLTVISSKQIAGTAMWDLQGTLTDSESIDATAWNNLVDLEATSTGSATSKVMLTAGNDASNVIAKSGGDLQVGAGAGLSGSFTSGTVSRGEGVPRGSAIITAIDGIVDTLVDSGGSATVNSNQSISNLTVTAAFDASVTARHEFEAREIVATQGNAFASALNGNFSGTVRAGTNATVFAGGAVAASVTAGTKQAGDADVSAKTKFSGIITASQDINASAEDEINGTFDAGRDLTLVSREINGAFTADRDARLSAAGPGARLAANKLEIGNDVWLSSGSELMVNDGKVHHNASIFAKDDLRASITTVTGDISITSGGSADIVLDSGNNVSLAVLDELLATGHAKANVTGIVWGSVAADLTADGNFDLSIEGDFDGKLAAEGNISASIMGIQAGELDADGSVSVLIGKQALGKIDAGSSLTVDGRDEVLGEMTAGGNADVFALLDLTGNVTAGADATVVGWQQIENTVAASNATVVAAGKMKVTIEVDHRATSTSYGPAEVEITAGDAIDLTAYQRVKAELHSGGTISATLLSTGELEATAVHNIDVTALEALKFEATTTVGSVTVAGYDTIDATVTAAADASVIAVGSLRGHITAGGYASASVVGTTADLQLSGGAGVSAFASDILKGQFASGGDVSLAGGILDVIAQAGGNVSVFAIDDVTAAAEAAGSVELFAGRSLVAYVEAGVDASAVSLGTLVGSLNAGRDVVSISLGASVVGIVAQRDATAAAYEVLHADVIAGRDVLNVWARGDLSGSVQAAEVVRRVVSYGSIAAIINANDIEVIEAWGAIGGAITALNQIGLIRSGDEVFATITGSVVGDVNEFDPEVFATQYPEKPEISLESFKAWIRGLQRNLQDARDALVEMRAGSFRLLAAEAVAAREGANPTLGDRREAEAVVTVAVNELLVALATATEADVQALKDANRNLDFATRQLQAALGKGRDIADFDLERSQALAELQAEELTERLGTRDDARSKLLAEKEAQMQGAMDRFDAAEDSWTKTFASKVDDLISSRLNAALDVLQFILDVLGFVPVLGAIPDLINAGIFFLRGRFVEAGLNLVAAIPAYGDGMKVAKMGGQLLVTAALASLKYADDALDLAKMGTGTVKYLRIAALTTSPDEIVN